MSVSLTDADRRFLDVGAAGVRDLPSVVDVARGNQRGADGKLLNGVGHGSIVFFLGGYADSEDAAGRKVTPRPWSEFEPRRGIVMSIHREIWRPWLMVSVTLDDGTKVMVAVPDCFVSMDDAVAETEIRRALLAELQAHAAHEPGVPLNADRPGALTLTAALFDEFWDSVLGVGWYIEEHDDATGTIDNVTPPDATIRLESTLAIRWQGDSNAEMAVLQRQFTFLTKQELTAGVFDGIGLDGMQVLRRWLNVTYPTRTGDGTVQLEVPEALADQIRGLIDAYKTERGL